MKVFRCLRGKVIRLGVGIYTLLYMYLIDTQHQQHSPLHLHVHSFNLSHSTNLNNQMKMINNM